MTANDWPTPHNAAAARYELERTMVLIESIAVVLWRAELFRAFRDEMRTEGAA